MCYPVLAGLILTGAGYAAQDIGKQRALKAQSGVLNDAAKDNAATAKKNRRLIMGEVKREAPSNVAGIQSGAAGEQLAAQNTQADQAVKLFEGSGGSSDVSGRVLAAQTPRFAAESTLEGYGEGRRRLMMAADRTNARIDANNSAFNRRMGLLPASMQTAANSGAGLSMLGQGLGIAGSGLMGGSIWSAAPAAANAAGTYNRDPYAQAGATDIRRNPYQT